MENNIPTTEWLRQYELVKEKLQSPTDLNQYFTKKEIAGKPIYLLELGTYSFPSGKIVVRDPLVYLCNDRTPYFTAIPKGNYPLTVAVVKVEEDHYRYAAVRLKISENEAVVHREALTGNEDLETLTTEDLFFGFSVDAGLATLADTEVRDAWCAFANEWMNRAMSEGKNINIYDDLLAAHFSRSYQEHPEFQREGGDWISFQIPGTSYRIPMFQSGWGDGDYPVYFGYDKDGNVCDVVIHFIDIELELQE